MAPASQSAVGGILYRFHAPQADVPMVPQGARGPTCPETSSPTGAISGVCEPPRSGIICLRPVTGGSQPGPWRPSAFMRFIWVSFAVVALVLGLGIIGIAAGEGALLQGLGFVAALFWLPGFIGLRYAFRTRIEAGDDALLVVTTFGERRIPWGNIVDASASYGGVSILLEDGSTFVAGAVQKNNIDTWRNKHTTADEVADVIVARSRGSA